MFHTFLQLIPKTFAERDAQLLGVGGGAVGLLDSPILAAVLYVVTAAIAAVAKAFFEGRAKTRHDAYRTAFDEAIARIREIEAERDEAKAVTEAQLQFGPALGHSPLRLTLPLTPAQHQYLFPVKESLPPFDPNKTLVDEDPIPEDPYT